MPWLLLADDTCEEASRFWNLAAPVFGQPAAVTCCNDDGERGEDQLAGMHARKSQEGYASLVRVELLWALGSGRRA